MTLALDGFATPWIKIDGAVLSGLRFELRLAEPCDGSWMDTAFAFCGSLQRQLAGPHRDIARSVAAGFLAPTLSREEVG